jgi:hypothetical protein
MKVKIERQYNKLGDEFLEQEEVELDIYRTEEFLVIKSENDCLLIPKVLLNK